MTQQPLFPFPPQADAPAVGPPLVREGMNTPWGEAQTASMLAPGIGLVSTAGHGGLKLSPARQKEIPEYLRRSGGWYEEDCECAIPLMVFQAELIETGPDWLRKSLTEYPPARTVADWFPDGYERYTNRLLQPGESRKRDEDTWYNAHREDLIVCTAWGDWHAAVPAGMVAVRAVPGGHHFHRHTEERYFLVPAAEYQYGTGQSVFGFIVDPAKYPEIPRIQ